MEIRLLGPIALTAGGRPLDPGQPRQRALLAALLVDAGRVVPADSLVERVWGDRPPARARHAIQVYVSQLRRLPVPIGHRAGGYVAEVAPHAVDLHRFAELARAGRPGEALALWRGQPLEDVAGEWADSVRAAWHRRRVDAAVAWARTGADLDALGALAAEYPLVEPLAAALLRALHAAGRGAEALAHYGTVRDRLADELGVDPGPELQEVYRRLLLPAQPPAPQPREVHRRLLLPTQQPAQLPAGARRFAGRADVLARLDELGAQDGAVVALSGTAGVGKTTLAVHWAHRVRARFPDGQLYVNLRGFHPSGAPLPAEAALDGFLTALGVPAGRVPAGLDAQSALYRTLLADRSMLVLLDNARDAEHVRPLLPSSPGCLAIVTSRHGLAGLVAVEGADLVHLDPLDAAEGRALLARRLGADRVERERAAADVIVRRCAGLPLALAIVSARAARSSLEDLAVSLGAEGLDALSVGEPGADVRSVFRWSYDRLDPAAARLFRLLGLNPGADIATAAAAALAGHPAGAALRELVAANLLAETVPGRYAFHDLLHAFAAELVPADEREPALDRLFGHYVEGARTATEDLFGAGRAWLDLERANLVAVAAAGRPGPAIALAGLLQRYLDRDHAADARIVHTAARDAARAAGDTAAEAAALDNVGVALRRAGEFEEAERHHREALRLYRAAGDRRGEGWACSRLGVVVWRLGDYLAAREHHQAALDLFRETGDRYGEAVQLTYFGVGHRMAGELDASVAAHLAALDLMRAEGDPSGEADVLNNLGISHQRLGRPGESLDCHAQALRLYRSVGERAGEADALNNLGLALRELGRFAEAVEHHRQALAVCRAIGEQPLSIEVLNGLGAAARAAGDADTARASHAEALDLARGLGDRHEQAVAHDGLAALSSAAGDHDQAVRHWRHALAIYKDLALPDAERVAAAVQNLTS
ncbi:tetratricopeptide repeat protein [Dactylosporangium sp. CA-139114]|uniref:tetratricopeptide repeat protein n=1 Tax=Dactylosporangium sp. CA-139114 TaxID=3239931 RepID=UPI003D95AC60